MDALKSYIHEHFNTYVEDLKRAIRQPSVAASGEGISECAELMATLFRDAGAEVSLIRAKGAAPLLLAEFPGRSDRTLLFYNHYDVQPPDPLNEWTTPPFEPAVRDGKIYGRGTADNKGNIVSRLSAVKTLKAVRGGLPSRVKFLIEGEEEIGSVHFTDYVEEHKDALRCDACIWESGGRDLKERIDVAAGVKGICYLDLSLEATSRDLHSSVGAIVEGAGTRMVWALASLKDPVTGRIRVRGFYDRVRKPTPEEEEVVRSLPFDEEERKRHFGVKSFIGGKTGYEAEYDLFFMPTCTVCGISTGYTGPGSKTVLPRRAGAKVDFRMVPDQDPEEIVELVRRHFAENGFSDITATLLGGERAYRSPLNNPFIQMVGRMAGEATGREVVLAPTSAGTGPMYPVGTTLNVPIVSAGTSYWDSRGHAPNENIRLADYEETIYLMARVMEEFPRVWG
jgi:acetylornithine deacetylase/succinyl-diaminopimelate desuccinylase-like protein